MIIRSTTIHECWCPKCSEGQMGAIHDIMMSEEVSEKSLIGRTIKCPKCGNENIIDDVIAFIPTAFFVSSCNNISNWKSNDELKKWLDKE